MAAANTMVTAAATAVAAAMSTAAAKAVLKWLSSSSDTTAVAAQQRWHWWWQHSRGAAQCSGVSGSCQRQRQLRQHIHSAGQLQPQLQPWQCWLCQLSSSAQRRQRLRSVSTASASAAAAAAQRQRGGSGSRSLSAGSGSTGLKAWVTLQTYKVFEPLHMQWTGIWNHQQPVTTALVDPDFDSRLKAWVTAGLQTIPLCSG